MSSKTKAECKVPVLKGQEGLFHYVSRDDMLTPTKAEDKVLEYLTRMNRPFGAVDVAANLKGAVPKAAAQKILVALSEKGLLTQKTYGKTTFFVVNQLSIESVPKEVLAVLEAEQKLIDEENKMLAADIKAMQSELAKLKATPSDREVEAQINEAGKTITSLNARLEPLRSGAPLISEADLQFVDTEWTKWRSEWVRRRKVFTTFWQLATDSLPPQDAESLAEDLGIELDTTEHTALERSHICVSATSNPLKRKR